MLTERQLDDAAGGRDWEREPTLSDASLRLRRLSCLGGRRATAPSTDGRSYPGTGSPAVTAPRQGLHAQFQVRRGRRLLDRARGHLIGRQDDRVARRERVHRRHALIDLYGRGRIQVLSLPAPAGPGPSHMSSRW